MGASNSRETSTTKGGENVRIKYAAASMQGFGAEMEDAYAVFPDLDDTTFFFGLYDGHGGAEVALLCAKLFHVELQVHPNYHENLDIAIRSVFSRMDELLQQSDEWKTVVRPPGDNRNWIQHIFCPIVNPWYCNEEPPYIPPENTGSSVTVAVSRGNQIIIANVGDSHCIASSHGQAMQLSVHHSPLDLEERQRIERAGGKVDMDNCVVREAGQVNAFTMIQGMLATSRAIGDFVFKQNKDLPAEEQMVICDPDILSMEITDDIEFLVIASRGIWASLSRQSVVDFVHDELGFGETDLRLICERLITHAQPTVFDTTVILIQFKHVAANEAEESEESEEDRDQQSDAGDHHENKSDAGDHQENKSDAGDHQENKSDAGDHQENKSDASDHQENKSDAGDHQENKSDASDPQEVKPAVGDEEKPLLPAVGDEEQPFAPNG